MSFAHIDLALIPKPTLEQVQAKTVEHPPRILLLYGSNRERSYSRLAIQEAGRILEYFGAEVKIFHPKGLPLPEDADLEHAKVKELHELLAWSEGMVWCSPERHGSMSSIPKAFLEFEEDGSMKDSSFYTRIVDVMEELYKFTLLTRGQAAYLTDRYSERVETAEQLSKRVNQRS